MWIHIYFSFYNMNAFLFAHIMRVFKVILYLFLFEFWLWQDICEWVMALQLLDVDSWSWFSLPFLSCAAPIHASKLCLDRWRNVRKTTDRIVLGSKLFIAGDGHELHSRGLYVIIHLFLYIYIYKHPVSRFIESWDNHCPTKKIKTWVLTLAHVEMTWRNRWIQVRELWMGPILLISDPVAWQIRIDRGSQLDIVRHMWKNPGLTDSMWCKYIKLLLMEEIPNNHLGCTKTL